MVPVHVDVLVDVASQVVGAAACINQYALILPKPYVTVAVLLVRVIHLHGSGC